MSTSLASFWNLSARWFKLQHWYEWKRGNSNHLKCLIKSWVVQRFRDWCAIHDSAKAEARVRAHQAFTANPSFSSLGFLVIIKFRNTSQNLFLVLEPLTYFFVAEFICIPSRNIRTGTWSYYWRHCCWRPRLIDIPYWLWGKIAIAIYFRWTSFQGSA